MIRNVVLALVLLATTTDAQTRDPEQRACELGLAKEWMASVFAKADVLTGSFRGRVEVEAPTLVRNAKLSSARIGFSLRHRADSVAREVGFSSVSISDLRSSDRFGSGIKTHRADPDILLYLADVTLRPGWPDWKSYEETNYDGLTLDAAAGLFAQGVTITEWNADSAIDSKARTTQLVDVTISGSGNRPIRFWRPGPHYLVHVNIDKPEGGTLIWLRDCDSTILRVYGSRFNGAARLSADQVSCEDGTRLQIKYLSTDPRETGEMHPIFSTCPTYGRER